jgi:hypothetical protein
MGCARVCGYVWQVHRIQHELGLGGDLALYCLRLHGV